MHGLLMLSLVLVAGMSTPVAADLEVEISLGGTELVQGAPVIVTGTLRNRSEHELRLGGDGPQGFRISVSMWPATGGPSKGCGTGEPGEPIGHLVRTVPPGWEQSYMRAVDCYGEPGEYRVRFQVLSEGERATDDPGSVAGDGIWSGRIASPEVTVRIDSPRGVDLQAFEHFRGRPLDHPDELLESFPASTYAGYALLGGRPWSLDPVAELEPRGRYLETARENPGALPQMERLEAEREDLSRRRARLLEEYLALRPEFTYSAFLRLELATRLAYVKRYEEARAQCLNLQQPDPTTREALAAGELLEFLVERGHLPAIEGAGR